MGGLHLGGSPALSFTNTLVPCACAHLTHIYSCPESQRAGGLLGPRVWRGGLLGLPPQKLRNERWQWGKHQVTALKGLSHEIATHNVTLWSTNHLRVFCPVGWQLGAPAALLLGLCSALCNPKRLQSPKPAGAGQTDGTNESNKVRGGWGGLCQAAHQLLPGRDAGQCPGLLLFFEKSENPGFYVNLPHLKILAINPPFTSL